MTSKKKATPPPLDSYEAAVEAARALLHGSAGPGKEKKLKSSIQFRPLYVTVYELGEAPAFRKVVDFNLRRGRTDGLDVVIGPRPVEPSYGPEPVATMEQFRRLLRGQLEYISETLADLDRRTRVRIWPFKWSPRKQELVEIRNRLRWLYSELITLAASASSDPSNKGCKR